MKTPAIMLLTAAATWLGIYLSQPVWVEESNGRVAVVGRIRGTRFNVLVFDQSLLRGDNSITGLEITDSGKSKRDDAL